MEVPVVYCGVLFKLTKSNKFQVDKGVRQECVISLFVVVLDSVLKKTNTDDPGGIQWRPQQKLSDLDYADDKLDALIENAKQVGLRVNFKKTKLMRVETPNQNALATICNNSEDIIEDVEQFCYLGTVITMDGGAEADVNSRINKARHAFRSLKGI